MVLVSSSLNSSGSDTVEIETNRSSSYTKLLDYCLNASWQDECVKQEDALKSSRAMQISLSHSLIEKDACEELNDLEDAYKAMSKMTADYIRLEKSMAQINQENCHLPSGPYPVLKVRSDNKKMSSSVQLKQDYSQSVFKEGVMLCRDWLMEHYETCDGVSMLRSAMYKHYLDFCKETGLDPINTASFGKAVRATFEGLTTRRLGTRGHSKYHYHGLCVKESSPYRDALLSSQRLNNDNNPYDRRTTSAADFFQNKQYSRTSVMGRIGMQTTNDPRADRLFLSFPSHLSVNVSRDIKLQLAGFLHVYRAHCEALLELVENSDVVKIKTCLHEFWRDLRADMRSLVKKPVVCDVIRLCDMLLYRTIANLLIYNFMESIPVAKAANARELASKIVSWTEECMCNYHAHLTDAKVAIAKAFVEIIERQTSLADLCHIIRPILACRDDQNIMAADWRSIDFDAIATDISSEIGGQRRIYFYIRKCLNDFEKMLWQHSPLSRYLQFAENILRYSTSGSNAVSGEEPSMDSRCSTFMMRWCLALQIILRELTLNNCKTLGKLHVLGQVLTDYMLLLIEEERRARLEAALKSNLLAGKHPTESQDIMHTTGMFKVHTVLPKPGRPIGAGFMSEADFSRLTSQSGNDVNNNESYNPDNNNARDNFRFSPNAEIKVAALNYEYSLPSPSFEESDTKLSRSALGYDKNSYQSLSKTFTQYSMPGIKQEPGVNTENTSEMCLNIPKSSNINIKKEPEANCYSSSEMLATSLKPRAILPAAQSWIYSPVKSEPCGYRDTKVTNADNSDNLGRLFLENKPALYEQTGFPKRFIPSATLQSCLGGTTGDVLKHRKELSENSKQIIDSILEKNNLLNDDYRETPSQKNVHNMGNESFNSFASSSKFHRPNDQDETIGWIQLPREASFRATN